MGTERETLLREAPIPSVLAKLAIPATLGMFVNALYNVVDTIFIGRGVGPLAIGGLSIAFPIQLIVVAIGLGFGIGGSSLASRALGSGDKERAQRSVGTSLTLSVLSGIVLTVLGLVFIDPILVAFGATPDLMVYARDYLSAILPGTVFMSTAICASFLMRGEGASVPSMIIMLIGAGGNIILDPIFIFVLNMGIRGAAIATVAAQFLSFIYIIAFYAGGKSSFRLRFADFIPRMSEVGEIVTIGIAASVRQISASFFVVITNNALATFGTDLHVSAFGVVFRILLFALMPLFGLGQGFQPIAGFNYGAGNLLRVRESVRVTMLVAVLISTFSFGLIMLFPNAVFSVFTTDTQLLSIGTEALRIVAIAIPLVGPQIIGSVFFQAIGKAGPAFVLSLSRQVILLIPFVLIFSRLFGVVGIWASFPAADILAAAITITWTSIELRLLLREGCAQQPDEPGCVDVEDVAPAAPENLTATSRA